MESGQYGLMFALEESHWWYKGLRSLIISEVKKYSKKGKPLSILDAGCGTGYNLKCLSEYGEASGVDISDTALDYCAKRGLKNVFKGSVERLPFRDASFDIVVSADVLYHKAVADDIAAMNEMKRVMKNGGILIMNLPAFGHLRRQHDRMVHTRRRYTVRELAEKIRKCGLEPVRITYRNAFLYPAALAVSMSDKMRAGSGASDLKKVPGPANGILFAGAVIDNLLAKSTGLPFGTSVFCVAKKREE